MTTTAIEHREWKPDDLIEWGYDLPRYAPGKMGDKRVVVGHSHIEIQAVVTLSSRSSRANGPYARVTRVEGWPYDVKSHRRVPEIGRAFAKEFGIPWWGMGPALMGRPAYKPRADNPSPSVDPVVRLRELALLDLPFKAPTLTLKACPRCRGDVHRKRDLYGVYDTCLQCGWSHDVNTDELASHTGRGRYRTGTG